jgi:hypothetical protein
MYFAQMTKSVCKIWIILLLGLSVELQEVSPYMEIKNMEHAANKLKEFADDYVLNTNKPMDLVFFKV